VARAREALAAGHASSLAQLPVELLSFEALVAAAEADDVLARALLARAATYLGLAVANAIDNWDPELVVLSGPVIRKAGAFFEELLATEQRSVLETGRAQVRISRAVLEDDAKIIGAATLAIAAHLAAPVA
jgi:predicted NBD/HSP70 family sugar kinase